MGFRSCFWNTKGMRLPFLDINRVHVNKFIGQTLRVLSVVFLAALLLIPIAWFIWFVFFTQTFTVQAITIVDAREGTTEQLKTLLQDIQSKSIFWLKTPSLEQKIILQIPQVRDVHIVRKLPSTVKVVVQEKSPVMLLLSNKKYYFVDKDGIAYEEARLDTLPGVVLPIVKNSDQGSIVTLGSPVVEQSFITFVNQVQKALPEITPAQMVEIRIPSLAAREVHFHLNNNWLIRFDITRAPEGQLSVLKKLLSSTIPPEQQGSIEYIDLRIPQRVYYKIKGVSE